MLRAARSAGRDFFGLRFGRQNDPGPFAHSGNRGESEEAFNALLNGLIAEHQPTILTETLLVQDMAKYHWLIDRALGLQSEVLAKTLEAVNQIAPELGLLIRYQTANERAFQKAFAILNLIRKNALLNQPVSEP